MRVRVGVLRAFIGVLGIALLVMPVGVLEDAGPRALPLGEALVKIATGTLGIGILDAFVSGLTPEAALRLAMIVAAVLAFYLCGVRRREEPAGKPERRHECPACGFVTARAMTDCPACGVRITD